MFMGRNAGAPTRPPRRRAGCCCLRAMAAAAGTGARPPPPPIAGSGRRPWRGAVFQEPPRTAPPRSTAAGGGARRPADFPHWLYAARRVAATMPCFHGAAMGGLQMVNISARRAGVAHVPVRCQQRAAASALQPSCSRASRPRGTRACMYRLLLPATRRADSCLLLHIARRLAICISAGAAMTPAAPPPRRPRCLSRRRPTPAAPARRSAHPAGATHLSPTWRPTTPAGVDDQRPWVIPPTRGNIAAARAVLFA